MGLSGPLISIIGVIVISNANHNAYSHGPYIITYIVMILIISPIALDNVP